MLLPDNMLLENLDRRKTELDGMLIHRPEYKFRPTTGHIFWVEVSRFLGDPRNDELFWQLFRRFVLKKK